MKKNTVPQITRAEIRSFIHGLANRTKFWFIEAGLSESLAMGLEYTFDKSFEDGFSMVMQATQGDFDKMWNHYFNPKTPPK